MWRQTKSMRLSSSPNGVYLQQHNLQFNEYVALFYCLSKGTSTLLNLAKLSIGEKFSNAASAMAEQDINVQKEIRTRLRNSIHDTKSLLIKGGENRSSKKETWCRLSKNH